MLKEGVSTIACSSHLLGFRIQGFGGLVVLGFGAFGCEAPWHLHLPVVCHIETLIQKPKDSLNAVTLAVDPGLKPLKTEESMPKRTLTSTSNFRLNFPFPCEDLPRASPQQGSRSVQLQGQGAA